MREFSLLNQTPINKTFLWLIVFVEKVKIDFDTVPKFSWKTIS